MPKLIVVILLIVIFSNAFSQSNPSNEIVAEGGAKAKMQPDLATFILKVEKSDTIEKVAIMQLNKTVDGLINSLNSIGFKNDNIKVVNYDISSSINREDNKKIYTALNVLKINFQINNKLIDEFYTEIQEASIADLDVSFETSLSDSLEKAVRLKLVQQAIADAKINATNIAQSLGLRITKVKQVHKYGESMLDATKIEMIKFTPPRIKGNTAIRYNSPFDKVRVEDAELEERITVVYQIAN
jgi:uncharacterized protein